jgi:hypothetical protein
MRVSCAILVTMSLGCSTEPRVIGTASVAGTVFRTDGAPWRDVAVEATCSGTVDTTHLIASGDGTFGVNFVFSSDHPSTRTCHFAAPSLAAPQAATTQSINVYGPNLQPLQFVALREGIK